MKQRCYHCGALYHGDTCLHCGQGTDLRDMRPSPLDVARVLALVLKSGSEHFRGRDQGMLRHAGGTPAR